jgi:hypothetical protein
VLGTSVDELAENECDGACGLRAEIVRLRKALTDEGFKFCREQTVCTGCDNAADCEYAQEASDE